MSALGIRRWIECLFFIVLLSIFGPGSALADKLVMKNGDQLSGTVVSMAEGKLVFKTPYAASIVIDSKMVSELNADGTFEVALPKEKFITGKIVSGDEDVITVQGKDQATATLIPMEKVIGMKSVASDDKWRIDGILAAGITIQSGNTKKQALGLDGQLDILKRAHRIGLFADFNYEKNRGELTDDNLLLNANYDYFLNRKWFLFANDRFHRDKFADLTAQNSFGVGAGYQFWKSPEKNLAFRLGPSFVYQGYSSGQSFLNGDDSRTYGAAFWAIDLDIWVYKRILQFFHNNTGLLSLQDPENWGILTRTGFRIPLVWKLFATLQYNFDYAGQPADGRVADDGKFITRLGVRF
ncbi:MAG: DUF481 domain-containing protein [Deltaproteobacteria bacterium]|nr:DUF481 domain-containing protein [Deltaproteobacteria bacterium]